MMTSGFVSGNISAPMHSPMASVVVPKSSPWSLLFSVQTLLPSSSVFPERLIVSLDLRGANPWLLPAPLPDPVGLLVVSFGSAISMDECKMGGSLLGIDCQVELQFSCTPFRRDPNDHHDLRCLGFGNATIGDLWQGGHDQHPGSRSCARRQSVRRRGLVSQSGNVALDL